MYEILKKGGEKTKYLILSSFFLIFLFLLTVVFKNDQEVKVKEIDPSLLNKEIALVKEFVFFQSTLNLSSCKVFSKPSSNSKSSS